MIDLQCHSTASDGLRAPAEVVEVAAQAGLEAIALTDHDSTAGLAEAREAGRRLGVRVIGGCEFSVSAPWIASSASSSNSSGMVRAIVEILLNTGASVSAAQAL